MPKMAGLFGKTEQLRFGVSSYIEKKTMEKVKTGMKQYIHAIYIGKKFDSIEKGKIFTLQLTYDEIYGYVVTTQETGRSYAYMKYDELRAEWRAAKPRR